MTLLCLLILATPFRNDPRVGIALLNAGVVIVTPIKIVGLFAVVAALIAPVPEDAAPHSRTSLIALFLIFLVWPVVATMARGLPTPTGQISQLLSGALLFVAIIPLVRTRERLIKVARILAIAFALSTLWVYKQHFSDPGRPGGLEQDGNGEALMLLWTLPLAFWMARFEQSWWWRQIGLICTATLILAILLTESRGGAIGLAAVGASAALLSRRKILAMVAVAIAIVLALNFGPAGLIERLKETRIEGTHLRGAEVSSRIHYELVKAGVGMIEAHPFVGVGLEQFKRVAPQYDPELLEIADRSYIAHDIFLQIGAEAGLPALLLFVAMLAVAFRNLDLARRTSDEQLARLATAMMLSLIGISVVGMTITSDFLPFLIDIILSRSFGEVALAGAADVQKAVHPVRTRAGWGRPERGLRVASGAGTKA